MTEWKKVGPKSWLWDGDYEAGSDPPSPESGSGTDITVLGEYSVAHGGTLTYNGLGPITISGGLAVATPTPPTIRARWWRWRDRASDWLEGRLAYLGLVHYHTCWCSKCQAKFQKRVDGPHRHKYTEYIDGSWHCRYCEKLRRKH